MKTYLVTFLVSTVVTVFGVPILLRFAPRMGAVDLPSGRRVNRRVIPRLGGVAILLGFLAPLVGLFFWDNKISALFREDVLRTAALLVGAIAMAALGTLDDLRGTRVWIKLLVQVLVAVAAFVFGYRIEHVLLPVVGTIEMGFFALPITVLWIVGIVNAINLVDGLDGLAAGVSFFVCVVTLVVGIIEDYRLACLSASALGGALVGFLFFNFNPARIFMGDSGSMFIGYVLATTSLVGSKGSTAVAMLVPILAMGVPIMDTLLAIVRRIIRRQSVFGADRSHIHHRLLERGFTQRRAVLMLYAISVVFTMAALIVYIGRTWQVGVTLLVATVVIFGLMRAVGAFQFRTIRRAQREAVYSETAEAVRVSLPGFIVEMNEADDVDRVRDALVRFAVESNLVLVACEDDSVPVLGGVTWESESRANGITTRGYVSSKYLISLPGEPEPTTLKFGWYSDSGDVSPHCAVLLQLAADAAGRAAGRILEKKSGATTAGSDARTESDHRSRNA